MSCLRLTYREKEVRSNFLTLEKKNARPKKSIKYYPFGMQTMNSWTREETGNQFLYNSGTELNGTTGMYDLAFRNYDPVLGRFAQVDPLADMYGGLTPYNYANNDPVYYNDPAGLTATHGATTGTPSYAGCSWCSPGEGGKDNTGGEYGSAFDGNWRHISTRSGPDKKGGYFGDGGQMVYPEEEKKSGSGAFVKDIEELAGLLPDGNTPVLREVTIMEARLNSKFLQTRIDEFYEQQYNGGLQQASFIDGNLSFREKTNFALGLAGLIINHTKINLLNERAGIVAGKYSRQAIEKVKLIDKSLDGLNRTSRKLGVAGLAISGGFAGYNYFYGDGITASQAFDFAVTGALTIMTITNPALLIGFGVYGVLDAVGAFEGIKQGLGGDTIILKRD